MLLPLLSGIGLAASAGLNAYIPLLVIALADRVQDGGLLADEYEFISSFPGIVALVALVTIELVVDKSPWYRANDIVQSVIRPAAGALAFMAVVSRDDVDLVVALLAGLAIAGVVHALKAAYRLRVAPTMRRVLAPGFSFAEDLYAGLLGIVGVVVPAAVPVFLVPLAGLAIWTRTRPIVLTDPPRGEPASVPDGDPTRTEAAPDTAPSTRNR